MKKRFHIIDRADKRVCLVIHADAGETVADVQRHLIAMGFEEAWIYGTASTPAHLLVVEDLLS